MTRIEIEYCAQCRWLARAAWIAQELLAIFSMELDEVALRPGVGGVFRVRVNGEVICDRVVDGGFVEMRVVKQRVRDRVAPGRDLGHCDG